MTNWTTLETDLTRGDVRLLHDLAVVHRLLDAHPVPARDRLAHELGAGFAELVRRSLLETTARAA